ncbi:Gfo/Idh/MocA family protein [Pedobacter steynii]|uniref:Oxidoreductase n=1 Tax=Pedobacter steynii TaxID=430522 RepID=A0A1D7QJL0_9SPHI|nr:Gfo/Idh/MocA family oxidoreductase [Pedobacter steynii]AOM78864.1 hypothetical protein BFS30_17825 [Pedobacter steynii]
MKTYNIGIIGYGGFGKFLHHWWDKLEGVKVLAISDMSLDDDLEGDVKQYKKWQDLIEHEEIDIVSVATPPAFHVEIACEAMLHNKHVLLEKPIALTNEGAERILRIQKETGKVVTVDHMIRYNPVIQAFIALGKEKAFGELRHVEVSNYAQDELLPARHWFWNKTLSGGIFIEHGVHFFDIVNALTDQEVSKVYGCSHYRNERQEDQVSATVLFNGGLIASHYHSFSGPGFFEQTSLRLVYDLAKVEIEGWMPMKGSIKALVNEQTKEMLTLLPGFKLGEVVPVDALTDVSRPEGWGSSSDEKNNGVFCAGIEYDVKEVITGTFEIPQPKSVVYGTCLQHILIDLIGKVENPAQQLGISAEDAYKALQIAVLATDDATMRSTTQAEKV